jgi:S-adenosyl methyltransferase
VAGSWDPRASRERRPYIVDTGQAHAARVYDYWLGGKENYPADRQAAEQIMSARPDIIGTVRANRVFLSRAVRHLAAEAGIDQFLDIGAGLPGGENVHEAAQAVTPCARVVYVDNDPVVISHARALLLGAIHGTTAFVDADLRDPQDLIRQAAELLDFSRPVGITLLLVLQFVADGEDPCGIVAQLMQAVPPGSHLVLSHAAKDVPSVGLAEGTRRYNELVNLSLTRRTRAQVTEYFAGLELLEPGVVPINRWRPDPADPAECLDAPAFAGVARKP